MKNLAKVNVALLACFIVADIGAQDAGTPTQQWLDWNRPSLAAQLCDSERSPFRSTFSGTTEECEQEVSRLFDYCATKVPNISLPETLTSMEQARSAGIAIYDCVLAVHLGGPKMEEFRRKYPIASQTIVRAAGD